MTRSAEPRPIPRRGTYRGLYASLLDDPDYQRLSSNARLVLLTARLCAQAGAAAIFRVYLGMLSEQTGLEVRDVEKALLELTSSPSTERPWIYQEGPVLWVRNGLRWDPNLRLADEKHRKGVERAVAALPRLSIVARFCRYYEIASPFDGSGEGPGSLSEDPSPPSTESEVPETERGVGGRPSSPNGTSPHSPSGPIEVELP